MFTDLIPQQLTPQEQKWSDEAATVGLTWISKFDRAHGIYRFNSCLHEKVIQTTHVRRNKFSCEVCFCERLKNEATEAGLEWIINTGGHYGKYVHIACGKEIELQNIHVKNKNYSCLHCFYSKLQTQAKNAGLTWIKKSNKNGYSSYVSDNCGHFLCISSNSVQKKCLNVKNANLKN